MTPVVRLVDPIVKRPRDPEERPPLDWSHREAAGLRFERWRAERGDFDGDRFGLRPEPLPPVVRDGNEPRDGMWR